MKNYNEKYGPYEIEENTGVIYRYNITEKGKTELKEDIICTTPLIISAFLTNVNSKNIYVELSWLNSCSKEEIIVVEKMVLMNRALLKQLYDKSFDISDENIGKLIKYFSYIFANHQGEITNKLVTEKLGWHLVEGQLEFAPYSDKMFCAPEVSYEDIYRSIKCCGDRGAWYRGYQKLQEGTCIPAKIVIAASFASCLMKFFDVDPFIINFYGKTGIGKTLLLNIASSLWGCPNLIQNNNASSTALEAKLKFLNSMPLLLDEIKYSDSTNKNLNALAYIFSGGEGKRRGTTCGGLLAPAEKWENIMICSSEQPYIENGTCNGVINRVLDVDCGVKDLFADLRGTYEFFQSHYGYARDFFEFFSGNQIEKMVRDYNSDFKEIINWFVENGVSTKQASLGSVLIIASTILCANFFGDIELALTKEEIFPYLRTEKSIDVLKDTLSSLFGHIDMNMNSIISDTNTAPHKDAIGCFEGDNLYVNNEFVTKFLEKKANLRQFNKYLKNNNLIVADYTGRATVSKSIGGSVAGRCYCFKVSEVNSFLLD